ncbi:unnamed protein product [Phaeothamnion confervicola]
MRFKLELGTACRPRISKVCGVIEFFPDCRGWRWRRHRARTQQAAGAAFLGCLAAGGEGGDGSDGGGRGRRGGGCSGCNGGRACRCYDTSRIRWPWLSEWT